MLAAIMAWNISEKREHYVLLKVISINGESVAAPTRLNTIVLMSLKIGSGFSVLVCGFEALCFVVCPASHNYVNYSMHENIKLAKLLHLEEMAIPA